MKIMFSFTLCCCIINSVSLVTYGVPSLVGQGKIIKSMPNFVLSPNYNLVMFTEYNSVLPFLAKNPTKFDPPKMNSLTELILLTV